MRQDLVLSSHPPMLAQRSIAYPCRTARSSSLPLKILTQPKNPGPLSDKLIHSWNGSLSCSRLCLYTNLSVSDFCINLIGSDLPITDIKQLLAERKQDAKVLQSSDESTSDSSESIATQPSATDSDTQFALDEQPDSTVTSSGYSSEASHSDKSDKLADTELDETCRNSDSDSMSCSSSDEDLFKEFRPKKSCLKRLCLEGCGEVDAAANATSSPLHPGTPVSPTFSLGPLSPSFKKRVSFADTNGKELCTIRTMSEPSNCPPKLTSKIVEYILQREMAVSNRHNAANFDYYSNYTSYGISSACTDRTDAASIAVYSLNFAQPAGDYLTFRQRLDEKKVCLENVVLNRFSITGTIKVKNINFDKQVFVRCSLDKWSSYLDTPAQYVPTEYYSTAAIGAGSPTTAAYSATFYEANYQPPAHKDYDTFRFQFDLPKHVHCDVANSPNNIIQFCVCYRTGCDEYWDNNLGANYEILQYVIGIKKPAAAAKANAAKPKSNSCFRYDSAALSKANHYSLSNQSIYY